MSTEVVHHLYTRPSDLLPYCGVATGRDETTGGWNAGHDRDLLQECVEFGLTGCLTCLTADDSSGFTPIILDEIYDMDVKDVPVWDDEIRNGWE